MTALLFQLLKHGWQPLRELWREGGVEEILFEQRNKSYGAYELRRNEGWYFATALCIVLGGMLSLGWVSTQVARKKAAPEEKLRILRISQAMPPPPWFCGGPAPPPPPPKIIRCTRGLSFQIPVPAPLEEIEAEILLFAKIPRPRVVLMHHHFYGDLEPVAEFGDTLKPQEPIVPTEWLIPEITEEAETIFEAIKEMPKHNEFIFCDQEPKVLNMKEVMEMYPVPRLIQSMCIQGQSVFRVLVSETGSYLDHKVIAEVHPILTDYFSKIIVNLSFSPAQQQGENIAYWVNIPMNYKIMN